MVIEHGKRSMVLDCKYGTRHYIVYVPELHFQRVLILATSSNEAKELVQEGEGEYKGNELVTEVVNFIAKDKKRPICTPHSK